MMGGGLVTLEKVKMLHYRAGEDGKRRRCDIFVAIKPIKFQAP
jgi:hypothetical protein